MKTSTQKIAFAVITISFFAFTACNNTETNQHAMPQSHAELNFIFPKGEAGTKDLFTGNAYHFELVGADTIHTTAIGNVYFEPGARSNWHMHPGGQILIITDGIGYHQMEGQPIEIIKKGDVIKCPPGVKHWHGASPDVGLQQLYFVPNTEKGIVEWMEPVTDEQYSKIQ